MRNIATIIIAATILLNSQTSFAVFDGQIFMGKRSGTFSYSESGSEKEQEISSAEKGVAFHLNPLPLVPVSIGAFYAMNDYALGDTYKPTVDAAYPSSKISMDSNLKGNTYGPEITAWIPLSDFNPYMRLSYVMGTYQMGIRADIDSSAINSETSYQYDIRGTQYGIGINYSIVPTIAIFAEANFGTYGLSLKSVSTKEIDSSTGYSLEEKLSPDSVDNSIREQTFGSSGVLLGISAGI